MTATELKRHALALPTEEKLDLVEALWQSLEQETAQIPLHAWQEKLLAERIAEAERDPSVWAPEFLQRYREEILEVASRHGAGNVRIFGSLARGEGSEASDLDLLVTLAEGRSLLDLVGLKQDLEDLVHRPVDVVTEGALSPYLRDRILAEAVPL
jgi:putative addiction module component (TIGR02574 family)